MSADGDRLPGAVPAALDERHEAQILREVVRRIVELVHPEKVILFGSRARGEGGTRSDLDILGVAESDEPRYRRSVPIYGALSDILVPMDIIVYTPGEVDEWSDVPQAFVTTAVREGTVLYEKE